MNQTPQHYILIYILIQSLLKNVKRKEFWKDFMAITITKHDSDTI